MKNLYKLIGIIALVALIGFSFTACNDDDGTSGFAYELINFGDNKDTYRVRDDRVGERKSGALVIPASYNGKPVTEIGSEFDNYNTSAFDYASITSIAIPASITTIGGWAFSNCTSLTTVTLAAGSRLKIIDSYAFNDCTSLTGIEIPEGVTSIRNNAFGDCTSLTGINIPEGVTSIGQYAFSNCIRLTSIEIPASVTTIGQSAFNGCTGLTSVTIAEGVTTIRHRAFDGCTSITNITIPASVTTVHSNAFEDWTDAQTIYVPWTSGNRPSGWESGWSNYCKAKIVYQEE